MASLTLFHLSSFSTANHGQQLDDREMDLKVRVNNSSTTILEPLFLESFENSSLFRKYLF